MFITFHSHGSRGSLVPSVTGVLSAIRHVQPAYGQGMGGGSLLHAVLVPFSEQC